MNNNRRNWFKRHDDMWLIMSIIVPLILFGGVAVYVALALFGELMATIPNTTMAEFAFGLPILALATVTSILIVGIPALIMYMLPHTIIDWLEADET